MDSSLLTAIWRHRISVIVLVCLGVLLGFATSLVQPVRYSTEARLFLVPRPFEPLVVTGQYVDPARYVANQAEIAVSMPVLERGEGLLDGSVNAEALRQTVRAVAVPNLDLITITATAPTAEGAVVRAQAVTSAYRGLVREQVMQAAQRVAEESDAAAGASARRLADLPPTERDVAVQTVLNLRSRGRDALLQASLYGDGVTIAELPRTPAGPFQPKPVRNALVGGILGLLGAAAFALYRQENRFRPRKEARRAREG